ncbi:MAG: aromatic ring-hydroxylating dioxygenase subunit alpha [Gammaproteobacteria bacterium]|nr:aromatic ring-hydroxylating dioxygenase subunit alpha [Gammaproteobacteria bacterium]
MNSPVENRFTQQHPELGRGPVQVTPNISPDYFELEREKIFKQSWLNVGCEMDIPNKGDYFVKDIQVLNASLIIVRGKDSVVRAFHNACTHRGNKVAESCGHTKGFACGFHGWTFDTKGELAYVPDEGQFFDLDKSKLGLKPVPCESWNGFIFIHPQEKPPQPLAEFLGGLGQQLQDYPFQKLTRVGKFRAEVKVNWKVIIDAFQESYHAGFVHKYSAGNAIATGSDPFCHMTSFRLYEQGHRSGSCPLNPDHELTRSEQLATRIRASIWAQETSESHPIPPGANPENHPLWMFDINVVFPNFFIDVANGWFFTYNFWPVAVDKTLYEISYYMDPPNNAGEKISVEHSKISLRDLLREDLNTVETTQAALMSGALETILLSDQELLCRHQYKVVDQLVTNQN